MQPNGVLTQQKDQDETSRSVRSLLESQKCGLAVGLIIGLSFSLLALSADSVNATSIRQQKSDHSETIAASLQCNDLVPCCGYLVRKN